MNWRDLPPLAALRAFAAFVQTGSVVRAGAALGVSHAAISQQLRLLEAQTGLSLFSRAGRELSLTPEGYALGEAALAAFTAIARSAASLTEAEATRPLQITTTPSFASGWLMPRLADFRNLYPGIDLAIDPTPDIREIGPNGADLALRYGNGNWPGLVTTLIVNSSVVVVAAPSLIAGRAVESLDDVANLPWLQELGTSETTQFMEKNGIARGAYGLTSLPGNLMLDAARSGQGIAVIARAFVEADVRAGRLQILAEDDEREGYFLLHPEGVLRPPVKAFVAWLKRQVHSP